MTHRFDVEIDRIKWLSKVDGGIDLVPAALEGLHRIHDEEIHDERLAREEIYSQQRPLPIDLPLIAMIKALRSASKTSLTLREAKDIVEHMVKEIRIYRDKHWMNEPAPAPFRPRPPEDILDEFE